MRQAEASDRMDAAVRRALRAPGLTDAPPGWISAGLRRLESLSTASATSGRAVVRRRAEDLIVRARRFADEHVRELLGQLVFDTAEGAALAGVRGGDVVARQILFQYPDAKLYLRVSPQAKGLASLAGQYVPLETNDPLESVTLHTEKGSVDCVGLEDGEFRFENVATGSVYVSIRRRGLVLAFDPIRI